ncbi:cytidylyltransferase domain-containing protein [Treponema pedis]|uniref:Putative N-acylneuraminate cytidylyltransferase n=1 Tax=Treponema pedis str. T A4 TaxID=1291379 RepID=S5ZXG9_9SPIR|nr:acylneuraminate cytidylyltransferase family protein [Treponema pedis]AGT42698.1 putative N-acylneuraminate cytidylyltransferase [Treponema pedis str. T A4]QSI03582.1 acylneuraminate cytidylyltransferase family protein [Treponema pedis]
MKYTEEYLFVIPARGGSKGIPHKNIKPLNGKPLICYSIDIARSFTDDENICLSTDDKDIIAVANNYGLKVPFVRPDEFATDTATTNDVLLHALEYYETLGRKYKAIVLLQPTSPLRSTQDVLNAIELYIDELDMVVSVKTSDIAAVICEENSNGFLEMSFSKNATRRQDVKPYYEYNGAVYVINPKSLKDKGMFHFTKIKKTVMDTIRSIDIDTNFDWQFAEFILHRQDAGDLAK